MFVYIIIILELAVLYVIFWIVFLREPSPREIRAELWGNYANPKNQSPKKIDEPLIQVNGEEPWLAISSFCQSPGTYRISKLRKKRRKSLSHRWTRSSYPSRYYSCGSNARPQRPIFVPTQQASRTAVEKFLLSLNRVLNKLSVKLP